MLSVDVVLTNKVFSTDVFHWPSTLVDSDETNGYLEIPFFALGLIAGLIVTIQAARRLTLPNYKHYFTWSNGHWCRPKSDSTGLI